MRTEDPEDAAEVARNSMPWHETAFYVLVVMGVIGAVAWGLSRLPLP